ncbi:MAG TPA: phosphate ABC transporter permease PtsA [Elusimicrobia bacterium]|nr:MAG: phosphate ABC transporter, permease protein PstA [Elusimicrobia bacterium RIFOXYA12_FULL_49_49]OGS09397.1 MAG: phosphate ABC transporter, permease protein PstA [Elusimicrobia bacterium RIFOXYA1_FULL_47_7]OGS11172.1 MAG: phosphate ABC transporter, permease protein PstA [Elusimicrobia bacterium RIFOXYB1_FULL_48_9]OGS14943.1 MAG: phosphate ABC transporter, permease protein PstA [Elusimicrobia bacterium RIFOXYA2_FULL_47_53]OGS26122.1 MAG: phosphate ABC transporter, permease protein PstA [El
MNPKLAQKIAFIILLLATILVIVPVGMIVVIIVVKGAPAINWEFLLAMPSKGMRAGGIFPAIVGTIYLVAATILFAIPVGVFSAIYLVEYARENLLTRMVKLAIINLAGVPSIVYGLFGLGLFVIFLGFGPSIIAGALTLAIMILPIIITTSKEALDSVPRSYREASLALGASKWQTIRHVVLPSALPGILTGIILGISRAAGETAPILFTVAAFYLPRLPRTMFDQVMVLPYHLFVVSTQIPNIKTEYTYATALVLVGIVLIANLAAIILRSKYRKKI